MGSGLGTEFALPSLALAQNPSSPDAALRELIAGNQRFTAGRLTAHEHDLEILKQQPSKSKNHSLRSFPAPIPACRSS